MSELNSQVMKTLNEFGNGTADIVRIQILLNRKINTGRPSRRKAGYAAFAAGGDVGGSIADIKHFRGGAMILSEERTHIGGFVGFDRITGTDGIKECAEAVLIQGQFTAEVAFARNEDEGDLRIFEAEEKFGNAGKRSRTHHGMEFEIPSDITLIRLADMVRNHAHKSPDFAQTEVCGDFMVGQDSPRKRFESPAETFDAKRNGIADGFVQIKADETYHVRLFFFQNLMKTPEQRSVPAFCENTEQLIPG